MPRASAHARRRRAETAAARRKRRLAGLILLASVALITLLLTAFGSGGTRAVPTAAPAPATRLLPAGPPRPQVVSLMGSIRLLLPVAQGRLTAVGYHAAGDGSLALRPVGRQLNQGLVGRVARSLFGNGGSNGLRYYVLGGGTGPATTSLDIGAPPGTDVYSPVDGRVVAITPYVLAGKHMGARIDIQPSGNPVARRLAHARPPRPEPDRRLDGRRDHLQGRDDHRLRPGRAPGPRARDHRCGEPRGDRDPPRHAVTPLRILFIADVFGTAGRKAVEERLPGLEGGARRRLLRRQRRERRRRGRDHAAPRRPAAGGRGRRDHARQPRLAPPRDRALPRDGRARHPARRTWPPARRAAGWRSSRPRTGRRWRC